MSNVYQIDEFAFGQNSRDGCPCPAMAAGYNPEMNNVHLEVAEDYDCWVKTELIEKCGVVDEEKAKKAWLEVMEYYEELGAENHIDFAQEVAQKLGWLETEES